MIIVEFYLEILVGIISSFIALMSLWVSIKTTKEQINYNQLSMRPICELYTANFDDDFSIEISNKGLGPLNIDSVELTNTSTIDNQTNLIDFIPKNKRKELSFNNIQPHKIIISGETIKLIYSKTISKKEKQELIDILSNIEVKIFYSDLYSNKYTFKRKIEFVN